MKKPLLLMILDGFGLGGIPAMLLKRLQPPIRPLICGKSTTQIGASGLNVGLPDGQMGNSEVGHTNIGAGRIVYQELTRITKAIEEGSFFENEALDQAMEQVAANSSSLHLMGLLLSPTAEFTAHNSHLYALIEMAKRKGIKKVYIHAFLDGRDVPPSSGQGYVANCQKKLEEIGVGRHCNHHGTLLCHGS